MSRQPFSFDDLNPNAEAVFRRLAHQLVDAYGTGRTKHLLKPFEGFRSLERQKEMIRTGVSKAAPWQSAHQYGLAVDYVCLKDAGNPNSWFWPDANHPDWAVLGELATNLGLLRDIAWDKPHVEHPIFRVIKRHVA